jgi:transcription elongation GreA/GreB family factor
VAEAEKNTQLASECRGRAAERAGRMAEARIRELEAEVERKHLKTPCSSSIGASAICTALERGGERDRFTAVIPRQTLRR